ncbi:hypothetical protein [Roseivirga sp.]|uniref:hypothetical protein n=1 Tax=Roseivirga sp. TaxID=1964215 RepID=UPI003B5233B5
MAINDKILYIEHKSKQDHKGMAWIGFVEYSKSGKTIYFNGLALKKLKSPQQDGNYYDLITKEIYWVSGVKLDGNDRHWLGSGKVKIDQRIIKDYLSILNVDKLEATKFEIVEIKNTDKEAFKKFENESHN